MLNQPIPTVGEKNRSVGPVTVCLNKELAPMLALQVTGHRRNVTTTVIEAMPRRQSVETTVHFFRLNYNPNDEELEEEYADRGLVAADPFSLAAVNMDYSFSEDQPNATHWKNAEGQWCYLSFSRVVGVRWVDAHQEDSSWDVGWWFAGLSN